MSKESNKKYQTGTIEE